MSADAELVFVDTNVLVYAYDRSAGMKRVRACSLLDELWSANRGCLSIQVLQEFFVSMTQKVHRPLSPQAAADILRDLLYWKLHAPVGEDVLGAIDLQRRHRVSFWDAMILWSARQLGCRTLWSEDLNPDRSYDGVRVQNPFLS
jgi:predicted nucleic acid-binding protein